MGENEKVLRDEKNEIPVKVKGLNDNKERFRCRKERQKEEGINMIRTTEKNIIVEEEIPDGRPDNIVRIIEAENRTQQRK